MKILIFVLCLAAFVCGLAKADIESSGDKDNVTTPSGNVTLPNKEVKVTTVGEDKEEAESKVEEADEGQLEARDTTLTNHTSTSSSNTTDADDDEDKTDANVTNSTSDAKETHDESNKTDKRHAVYNVYYAGGQSQQLQQQTTTPHSIYSYVDFRQSRRYADTIPGVEGRDYPIFATVPPTSFSCAGRSIGLYGDVEARCQVWHNCQLDGRKDSFLCPNGTLFNQQVLVCDWWYNVECETTPSYYGVNAQLVQQSSVGRHAYQGYRQQVNRYQDAAGTTGYYYNYQKPFYVQTTTYPTSYYFDTGRGAYSGSSSAASAAASASAGSSFVATNNLYGGNGAGYYYRPSYQRLEGGGNVGLGGYGYTVSTHTPGYVTMRYDIPGGHYSSNSASATGASPSSGGGFQYQYSTGQLPSSYAVPTITGTVNTGRRVQYNQRATGGDRPDHPNYNEKSGYNYRPPQIPIPAPVRPPQPVAPPTTTTQIYPVTDTRVVQPKISIPIQPLRVVTPPSYEVVDHPNANEKSGYVQPQVSVPAPTAQRGSQAFNYAFSTYGDNQNAQIPVVRPPTPVAPTGTGYSYSTYNKVSETVHPNANEKSGYVQSSARQGGGAQTTNYQFSTYESNRNVQVPAIKPVARVATTSYGQASASAAAAAQSSYSHSSYNAGVDLAHPNANEKSGYTQSSGGSRGGSQTTNYAFSTYNSNGNVQYPVIKAKPVPVSGTYTFSTYNTAVDHPNANEKSSYTSPPYIPVTQPPIRVTQPPIRVTQPPIRVTQPPIRVPKPTIRVTHDPIDHPNYNEKSGYNQRPLPVGPVYPPGIYAPKVVISPPEVQVDCTGAYTCRPASPSVQVRPDYETAHLNFGQRVEVSGGGVGGAGSVAASDRSAGAVQQQDNNGGYY